MASPEDLDLSELSEIVSINFDGDEVVVIVNVQIGIKKVTLEGRPRLDSGNWTPRAIKRVDGTGGQLVFRITRSKLNEILRVRGDAKEVLPALFYKGATEFSEQIDNNENPSLIEDGGIPIREDLNDFDSANKVDDAGDSQSREVVESDIWSIHNKKLYFFNRLRGLQIIDLEDKANPVLRGSLSMPASGEQMYMLGDNHIILLARDGCNWWNNQAESQAIIVDISDDTPFIVSTIPVRGYIRESRLVGSALYVASQIYRQKEVLQDDGSLSNQWEYGTMISSFDLSNPVRTIAKDSLFYSGYNNDIYATDKFLFISTTVTGNYYKTDLRCIDISAADGAMKDAATIRTSGRVVDKFKMRLADDTLTVISETLNRNQADNRVRWETTLETFSLATPSKPDRLGELSLAKGERLFATRFDTDRVYIVTYEQIDPLWIVDLSDPRKPEIKGELKVPGWSTYIQPLGDRLVSIGVDDTDNKRRVAVSLFDVSDVNNPKLFDKVSMGESWSWSEAQYDEKAFTVLPHAGLILVPYQGHEAGGYAKKVQIIDLGQKTLKKRGVIEHSMQPRRATEYQDFIMSISGQELLSVDAADRDRPLVKGKLELSYVVDQIIPFGDYLLQLARGANWYYGEQRGPSLRVVSKSDIDTSLSDITLNKKAYLSGASIRNDRLYLLQTKAYQAVNNEPAPEKSNKEKEDSSNLFLTVLDLSKLPKISIISELSLIDEKMGWNNQFKANWPSDGKLLWSNKGGNRNYGWSDHLIEDDGMRDIWWPGYGGGAGQLICFDVNDPAKPVLASNINLSTKENDEQDENNKRSWHYINRWNFSESFHTKNGLVYLSSQHSEYFDQKGSNDDSGSEEEIPDDEEQKPEPQPQPRGYWVTRYELHVVDYTDPLEPVVREALAIPGSLIGISHDGALVYTYGTHWTEDRKWDGDWFDAISYDGLQVHLVDSIEQPNSWPRSHVLTKDGTLFLAFTERIKVLDDEGFVEYENQPFLQSFALDETGSYAMLDEVKSKNEIQQLAGVGGKILGIDNQRNIYFLEISKPSSIGFSGKGRVGGCLWFNLDAISSDSESGIWIPLGQYGASQLGLED